jgi:hypothetical protein
VRLDELAKAENQEADYVVGDEKEEEEEEYSPTSPAEDDGGWRGAAPSSVVAAPPSSLVLPGGGQKSEPLPTSAVVPSQSVAVPSPPGIAEDGPAVAKENEQKKKAPAPPAVAGRPEEEQDKGDKSGTARTEEKWSEKQRKEEEDRELKPATESNRAVGAPPPLPAEEAHIDQEKQFMMKLKQDQERALEAIAEQMVIEESSNNGEDPELQLVRCMLEVNQQLIDKVKAKMKKKKEEDRMMQRHGEM